MNQAQAVEATTAQSAPARPEASGFPVSWLEYLHCPYCGSDLHLAQVIGRSNEYVFDAIVQCDCYRYPLLHGILVLRQEGLVRTGDFDAAVQHLQRGHAQQALSTAVHAEPDAPWGRSLRRLGRLGVPLTRRWAEKRKAARLCATLLAEKGGVVDVVHRLRHFAFADYLTQRYTNPSFVAALPLLMLCKNLLHWGEKHRVLDLGCGAGHSSFLLQALFPELQVVAVDLDFTNLYMARRYMMSKGVCLCLDAQVPLPFNDDFFQAVFCLDAFHYMNSKQAVVSELDRCVEDHGLWLFPHLHNALQVNPTPGVPLRPSGYQELFKIREGRMYSEATILNDFMRGQMLDLSKTSHQVDLRQAHALSFVGGDRPGLWGVHEDLGEILLQGQSPLAINPIYKTKVRDGAVELHMQWPNGLLAGECAEAEEYLVKDCAVDLQALREALAGELNPSNKSTVKQMLEALELVRLPPSYGLSQDRCLA